MTAATPVWAANRSLTLYNTHTKETATIVYKRNGRFDADGLRKLNQFLRDWRRNEKTQMDPALFDLIWQVVKETRAKKPVHVVSGYRSPATNNMLRSRSRGVAKNSRHTKGQAMDFYLPGVSTAAIRNAGLRLQAGGVGFYPGSRSPFVHIDTGNVRHWPRMSRKQLAKVFPSGKTVHVPRDGKPFSGYKVAKAEVAKRKAEMARSARSASRFTQFASAAPSRSSSGSQSKLQLAKLSSTQEKGGGSLLQNLLKRTPKAPPKPEFSNTQTSAEAEVDEREEDIVQAEDIQLPEKLAKLPQIPIGRQSPQQAVQLADSAPTQSETEQLALTGEETTIAEPLQFASLPRTRPQSSPLEQTGYQLASAEPVRPLKALPGQRPDLTNITSSIPASANAVVGHSDGKLQVASLVQVPVKQAQAQEQDASETKKTGNSAAEILAAMTNDGKQAEAPPTTHVAYASTANSILSTLPETAPRNTARAQIADLAAKPKLAPPMKLASLPNPAQIELSTRPKASAGAVMAKRPSVIKGKKRSSIDHFARLSFAYGPSGMAHFAHMKQPARTATFARLSRPVPENLKALFMKPERVIDQGFSRSSVLSVADKRFSGKAVARLMLRSFQ